MIVLSWVVRPLHWYPVEGSAVIIFRCFIHQKKTWLESGGSRARLMDFFSLKMMCKSFLGLPLFVILLRSWGILKTRILSNTVSSLHGDQYLRAESPSIFLENIGIFSRKVEGNSARRVGDLIILWIKTVILEKKIFQSFIVDIVFR